MVEELKDALELADTPDSLDWLNGYSNKSEREQHIVAWATRQFLRLMQGDLVLAALCALPGPISRAPISATWRYGFPADMPGISRLHYS